MYHHNIAPTARSGLLRRVAPPRRTLSTPIATEILRHANDRETSRFVLTLHPDDDSSDLLLSMHAPPVIFIEPDDYY